MNIVVLNYRRIMQLLKISYHKEDMLQLTPLKLLLASLNHYSNKHCYIIGTSILIRYFYQTYFPLSLGSSQTTCSASSADKLFSFKSCSSNTGVPSSSMASFEVCSVNSWSSSPGYSCIFKFAITSFKKGIQLLFQPILGVNV